MAGAELIGKEEIKEVMDVLETGILMRYGFDKERKGVYKVRQFEEEFAKYCGVGYALGVTSGSSALQSSLDGDGCRPRRRCAGARLYIFGHLRSRAGSRRDSRSWLILTTHSTLIPRKLKRKKRPIPRRSFPSTCADLAANIDQIVEIARKNKLLVLEDNAQGCGASFKGKKLGGFGDMGTFSFDYVKTVTTGEGGMVITNNRDLYLRSEWYSRSRP
ncbi:MAG: DegT/DnrJ/EryC1/StrS family aminotransferase [Desulfosudis oleivorans]|nr:DegT/DnrJ/EryC1/StrS family aminotransferase [Desulfosudis oleivorans]